MNSQTENTSPKIFQTHAYCIPSKTPKWEHEDIESISSLISSWTIRLSRRRSSAHCCPVSPSWHWLFEEGCPTISKQKDSEKTGGHWIQPSISKGNKCLDKGELGVEGLDNISVRGSTPSNFPQKCLDFSRSQSKPHRLMGIGKIGKRGVRGQEERGNREDFRGG